MLNRRTIPDKIFDIFNIACLFVFCITIVYPFINLISISLSSDVYVLSGQVSFYPKGFDLYYYKQVLKSAAIIRAFANTFFVAIVGCIMGLILTSLAAYPLVFAEFDGKKLYTSMIVLTMWFSGGLIPTFLVISKLGLLDSLFSLITVQLIGTYNIIVLRSFFKSIPDSLPLVESAKIDGANDFSILFTIIIPLSKAALATIGLWIIVGHWNDFMSPLVYLRNFKKYTLQIVLRDIVLSSAHDVYKIGLGERGDDGVSDIPEQIKHAVLVASMIPVLILYPFLQKYFVKGVLLGAIKG